MFQNAVAAATRPASRLDTALNPDRHRPHSGCVASRAVHRRAQHGIVARHAGHPDPPALQRARRPNTARRDHRREWPLDERRHADDIRPVRARQGQVVDVEHGEVGAAGRK
jgi:hypothetical protein